MLSSGELHVAPEPHLLIPMTTAISLEPVRESYGCSLLVIVLDIMIYKTDLPDAESEMLRWLKYRAELLQRAIQSKRIAQAQCWR